MDKYYTPDITEFRVGFECEMMSQNLIAKEIGKNLDRAWLDLSKIEPDFSNCFIPYVITSKDIYFYDLNPTHIKNDIRVKYLNREDIVNLGWKYVVDNSQGDGNIRWFDVFEMKGRYYVLAFHGHVKELGDNLCGKATIYARNQAEILFNGKIKNKSELRKIMQMVGIVNDTK